MPSQVETFEPLEPGREGSKTQIVLINYFDPDSDSLPEPDFIDPDVALTDAFLLYNK